MRKHILYLAILALLYFTTFASGQTIELDLETARNIALENNLQYNLAKEALNKSSTSNRSARWHASINERILSISTCLGVADCNF